MESVVCLAYCMPSSCGILVYKLVTSTDTRRIAFAGSLVVSMKLMKSVNRIYKVRFLFY